MDDTIMLALMGINCMINFIILWLVAPLYQIRGTLAQVTTTLKHHENRLLSLEERSNGR